MTHKHFEEKLDAFDPEISGMRVELHKLPAIEENFMTRVKSIKRLGVQAKKHKKLLMMYVEGLSKGHSITVGGLEESLSKGKSIESNVEGGETSKNKDKSRGDEGVSNQGKLKKLEMPVFSGIDPDSKLF